MAESWDNRRKERLDYIQSMIGELRKMANADEHQMLAYFLDMAYVESGDRLRSSISPRDGARRHPGAG